MGGEHEAGGRVRVCHVQLLPLLSGVQRVALDELERLDPARYDRHLVCREAGPFTAAAAAAGVTVHLVPQLVRPVRPPADVRAVRALTRLFGAVRPDVVHTHSSKPGVLGRAAARRAGVPAVVHTVHGFAFPAAGRLTRAAYVAAEKFAGRRCDAVVVLNTADRALCRDVLGLPGAKVRLLPNGVDVNRCRPADPAGRARIRREAFGPSRDTAGDGPVVGTVGRLWPQKDPLAFVAAADAVSRRVPGVRFVMIGDGELRAEVEAELARRGLTGRVRLLGWRDDARRLIGGFDLFLSTSRYEGMPLVVLESLAAAVPVVAPAIAGMSDCVADGTDGVLYPPGDTDAAADAVADLLEDHDRRRALGAAGRAKVERAFDVDQRVRRIEALYAELLGRG